MKKVQYLKIMAAAILGISGMFALQPGTLTGEKLTATVYANGEDLSVFENSGKYIKKRGRRALLCGPGWFPGCPMRSSLF